jgi:hypothetical protein
MGKDFFYVPFVQQTHHQPAPHPLPKPAQTCAFLPVSAGSQPPCLTAGSRPATLRCHVGGGGRRGVSPSHHPALRSTLQYNHRPRPARTLESDSSFARQLRILPLSTRDSDCHHVASSLVHLPPRRQQARSLSSVAVQNNPQAGCTTQLPPFRPHTGDTAAARCTLLNILTSTDLT